MKNLTNIKHWIANTYCVSTSYKQNFVQTNSPNYFETVVWNVKCNHLDSILYIYNSGQNRKRALENHYRITEIFGYLYKRKCR